MVLQGNLQLPITDMEAMSPLFRTIAWEIPELGCSASQMSNEHLEIFQGVVTVHKKLEAEGKSVYKDALITHYADSRAPDQISFGFSIRHEVEICDIKAYQSNDPDISIIFLDRFNQPYEFATDVELTRSHLTNAKTVATGMHIKMHSTARTRPRSSMMRIVRQKSKQSVTSKIFSVTPPSPHPFYLILAVATKPYLQAQWYTSSSAPPSTRLSTSRGKNVLPSFWSRSMMARWRRSTAPGMPTR